jgi:16S rRNA C1402 (ribose-2'-O) methylase RsmI
MLEPQQFQTQGFIDPLVESGITVECLPGVVLYLHSGLPNDKFVLEGFT